MSSSRFPHPLVLLTGCIMAAAIGSHLLRAGEYERRDDPVTGRMTFYGTEVSRTARIEPVTPCGSVYVTEPFAAVLEMDAEGEFVCNYVGKIALPKNYGVFPLYRLARAG